MKYVYKRTEFSPYELYTVGFYDPNGIWNPESDHETADEAAKRVHYLNGEDPIFEEIRAERRRQDEKFGEQNHPMLNPPFAADAFAQTAEAYKKMNESKEYISWFCVLNEKVQSVFAETEPEKQREKMVQAAAVAVAIIECLDRRK